MPTAGNKNQHRVFVMEKLLTVKELADYLGISENAISNRVRRGTAPRYVRLGGGRAIRFRASDVEAWLAQHTVDASGPPTPPRRGRPRSAPSAPCPR